MRSLDGSYRLGQALDRCRAMARAGLPALMTAYATVEIYRKRWRPMSALLKDCRKIWGQAIRTNPGTFKRIKAGWKPDTQKETLTSRNQSPVSPLEKASPAFQLPKVRRSNLPRPLSSFIGREKEIRQLERLVSGNRLVTITGAGGVGKTRLAIQVSEALTSRFRDGVWWVELAALFITDASKNSDKLQQMSQALWQESPQFTGRR